MAPVVGPAPTLVMWYMKIVAIRMACAVPCHQIVEQDGEF